MTVSVHSAGHARPVAVRRRSCPRPHLAGERSPGSRRQAPGCCRRVEMETCSRSPIPLPRFGSSCPTCGGRRAGRSPRRADSSEVRVSSSRSVRVLGRPGSAQPSVVSTAHRPRRRACLARPHAGERCPLIASPRLVDTGEFLQGRASEWRVQGTCRRSPTVNATTSKDGTQIAYEQAALDRGCSWSAGRSIPARTARGQR
jgi:hypothetical protein